MKTTKVYLVVIFILCGCSLAFADKKNKANTETQNWRYDLECAGAGSDGTYLVKVWSYSKKASVATEQCKKNAVHGVLFKGFTGKTGQCASQRPLINNVNVQNEQKDFFSKFFDDNGGDYMKYVLSTGSVESVKVNKEYKVGVVISVAKDLLRKDLESAGIIKSLGGGF